MPYITPYNENFDASMTDEDKAIYYSFLGCCQVASIIEADQMDASYIFWLCRQARRHGVSISKLVSDRIEAFGSGTGVWEYASY